MRTKGRQLGIVPRITIVTSGLHAQAAFEEGREDNVFSALDEKNISRMGDR